MKSIIKFLVALAVIASTLSSCKKYEDGPMISLRSKKARICRVWKDSNNNKMELKKDGSIIINGTAFAGSKWAFSSNKENIEWTFTYGSVTSTSSDKILRLTSKDLWLEPGNSPGTTEKYSAD